MIRLKKKDRIVVFQYKNIIYFNNFQSFYIHLFSINTDIHIYNSPSYFKNDNSKTIIFELLSLLIIIISALSIECSHCVFFLTEHRC